MTVMTRHFEGRRLPVALPAPSAPAWSAQAVTLDLTGLWRGVKRRWRWVAAPVIVAVIAGPAATLLIKPRYASTVGILVDPREFVVVPSQGGVSQGTSAELAASESETATGLLRSAGVLRRVVTAERLDADPEFIEPAGPGAPPPAQRALATLEKRIAVRRAERSFIVEVETWSREADKAARIANAVAQSYLADRASARSALAGRAADSLDARLDDLGRRVREADQKVAAYRSRNALIGVDGSLVAEGQIAELSKQLVAAQARVEETRKRREQVEAARRAPTGLGDLSDALASVTISGLRTRYAEASRQSANLAARLGPQHPDVVMARAQLADARAQLDGELSRIGRSAEGDAERARAAEAGLERRLAALKASAGETVEALVRLRELERQSEASRTIYAAMLGQAKLFTEQQGLDSANVRVVSPAVPSPRSSALSRPLVVAGALAGGLMLGLGLALVRELTDTALYERTDFASAARLPILAVLPPETGRMPTAPRASALDSTGTPLAGVAYRLADSVGARSERSRSLLLLSLEPGFTGTQLAFNTALALAVDDASVLFVDARSQGGLTACLDADGALGLSDVVGRRCALERAVFLQDEVGIGIVPAGRAGGMVGRPSPDRIHDALLGPAARFAHVVIEGGSPLSEASAVSYAAAVDDVVLVVGAGRTRRGALEEAVEGLTTAGANLRGLVIA